MLTADDFRLVPELAGLPEADLAWLASVADERAYRAGEAPFSQGDPADEMFIVLAGAFQIFTVDGGQRLLFGTIRAGEISGLLPFSRMTTFAGTGVVAEDARIAAVHRHHFMEMLTRMPELGQRLVARLTDRVRESSRLDQQREKMLALGKLSAGLAHELNNPASAIRRSAATLRARFDAMRPVAARLVGAGLSAGELEGARDALAACAAPVPGTLSALERSAREDDLSDWLADHGVPQPYVVAEVLAEEGISTDALDRLAGRVPPAHLPDVVLWVEKEMAVTRLLGEIEHASARISELVAAVKGYTHMDRAPERQPTDLHAGLDQTLTMLGHALRDRGLVVERRYADGLPLVPAYPGEINQVWTNLLDNAMDAAAGRLTITTRTEGVLACVDITDDGPGIPPDVRARIWEPFFTTKAPGEGTGMGLDVVHRIVQQHSGRVDVTSEPGRTTFTVCLPLSVGP